ncbi:MAG: two-component regulator propeller domain-containing protein [Bacteroidota bacterium]
MRLKRILFIALIAVLACRQGFAGEENLYFEHISSAQGLSQSEVNCIGQDTKGFIWIGTLDGLNRYDGYEFRIYRRKTGQPGSISDNYILSVHTDLRGQLWIGTLNGGLNRYNSEPDNFTAFLPDPEDPASIASQNVAAITSRRNGDLLAGTQSGLSVIRSDDLMNTDPAFRNYLDFEVTAILEDRQGFVWLGSWGGLYKISFDEKGEPLIVAHYQHDASKSESLVSNDVSALFQDREGRIWIGTHNGLDMLENGEQDRTGDPAFTHFQSGRNRNCTLPNNDILAIYQDSQGKLLIGTRGGGLCMLDLRQNEPVIYQADKFRPGSLSNNSVKCFYEDRTGDLWIGTLGGGINKLYLLRKHFNSYEIRTADTEQPPSNYIRAIYEDRNGLLWVGTLDGGLYTLNRNEEDWRKFPGPDEAGGSRGSANTFLRGKNIFTLLEAGEDRIWIGTNGGINIYDRQTGRFRYHSMDYNNPDSLMSNSVFSITAGDDGTLWIGTWAALHHFIPGEDGKRDRFVRFTNDPADSGSLSGNIVRFIYNDPSGPDLWIATLGGGLNRLIRDPASGTFRFIRYMQDNDDPESLSSNEVNMIHRSAAGDLWIATNDGLNRMIPGTGPYQATFRKYDESDGLPGNHIQSILEDPHGNLWLGTNNGLSRFDVKTGEFSNYDLSDGLQGNEFSEHTCFLSRSGEMFFGGVNGFNSFYPDSIRKNEFKPATAITNLLIFNEPVKVSIQVNGKVILQKSISETRELVLSYKENVFTLEFSALHFASPEKNKYAYTLEGFNEQWLYTDAGNRKATYTNLKGGTYIFKVKTSNNDGVWQDEPTVLKIIITPPFWRTWLAYFVYVLVIVLLAYAIYNDVKARERLKSEVALKNLEKEKSDELNQMKLQFFTNITHEFRTPLTLILTPLEYLIGTLRGDSNLKEHLLVMQHNARYLLRLISELMDFRKAETGSWKLASNRNELVSFVREAVSPFKEIAAKRNISFIFRSETEELEVWFDRNMLIKILNNLVYNAFKFTADGGTIEVVIELGKGSESSVLSNRFEILQEVSPASEWVAIKVSDNGIGISGQSIRDIFNRYYQVGGNSSVRHLGSGIGLALTKNLVLLNKGEIVVQSEREKGTVFIVRLPLGDRHLGAEEKVSARPHDTLPADNEPVTEESFSPDQEEDILGHLDNTSAPLILVVEDNDDMRHFIRNNLRQQYRVIEAVNGKEGYQMAVTHIPDLVVSDVMMPEMNGIELCRQIKRNVLTSHIPVVLLTALASVSDQIEGLETGADDYISKPFNYRVFEVRLENLIRSRKKLRERFGKEIDTETADFTLNRRDQEFLDRAVEFVKENIAEARLSVDLMSRELGMSRMQLHRKITALTDQTPGEFIRTIRLKEAAALIAEDRLTMAEIAYRVGFTAPSYFTTCFGRQFGISPKEYAAIRSKREGGF